VYFISFWCILRRWSHNVDFKSPGKKSSRGTLSDTVSNNISRKGKRFPSLVSVSGSTEYEAGLTTTTPQHHITNHDHCNWLWAWSLPILVTKMFLPSLWCNWDWISESCPSSCILKTRKRNALETESISILTWRRETRNFRSLRKSCPQSLVNPSRIN
jgi:hypothetical protein